ncbi:MAG: porin family protein [Nitrospirae bacterium]|nr:porin family protein [Nitrospirota bacterium]
MISSVRVLYLLFAIGSIFLPVDPACAEGSSSSVPNASITSAQSSQTAPAGTLVSAPVSSDEITTEEEKFDEEFGHFGITLGFGYTFAQTPESQLLYQHSIGGIAELSYGIRTGLRILVGGGYSFNSPHVAPPQGGFSKGPTSDYTEGYLGTRLALNPFFPSFFVQQPWVPYVRGDIGGISAGVSTDGTLNGRTSGFLGDVGVGVEGRAPEFPVGFFAEVRSQWLFLGPRIIDIVPVITGATVYF